MTCPTCGLTLDLCQRFGCRQRPRWRGPTDEYDPYDLEEQRYAVRVGWALSLGLLLVVGCVVWVAVG